MSRTANPAAKAANSLLYAVALPAILIALWWWATATNPIFFVPTPGQVLSTFFGTWFGDRFWIDVVPSVARFLAGVAIAIVAGIGVGLLIGLNRPLRSLTEPVFEFFRALPPPVLMPVLMLLFGTDDIVKVGLIALAAVWPVLLNTIEGVRATDPVQNDTSRSYGISGFNRVRYQVLPSATPQILAGVRQCLPIGLILMVISEMFAPVSGLGFQIIQFQRTYSIPEMWSGILVLGLIGFGVALLFRFVERRILRWYFGLKELENVG